MTSRASAPPARRIGLSTDVAATLALTGFSLAVVAGFARVFSGWGFFDNLAVVALVGHALGLLLRRVRVPGWLAVPLVFVALTWLIGFLHYRGTYSNLFPTAETADLFRAELDLVRDVFRVAVAPVQFGFGWDVLAAIGVGLAVMLSDAFAFRAGARAEALVPGGVLFVFVAAVGTDRLRVELSVLLVIAGAVTVMVLRRYHTLTPSLRLVRRNRRALLLTPSGLLLAGLIGVAAGFAGPRLPGADAEPLVDTGGGAIGGNTTYVTPLVDIRSRLTNQGDAELFVMEASQESYWRTATLPEFDGQQWRLDAETQTSEGALAEARDDSTRIEQTLRINGLTGRLIPAAADIIEIDDEELAWIEDLGTIAKSGDDGLERGDEFVMLSASPSFDTIDLAQATSDSPPDPVYLELPDDFPESAAATAREVTSGATSPFNAALTLQNWFDDPQQFTYDIEVQPGHGNNAIEAFLNERVGYCEQFAGTYAAMMRSLGIPARVAVGFTPGTETSDGVYSVIGKNAHAWAEVWFDGLGWVPFDPTPGRSDGNATNYTGVPAAQDDEGIDPDAADDAGEVIPPLSTVPTGDEGEFELPIPGEEFLDPPAATEASESNGGLPWWVPVLLVVGLAAAVAPWLVRRVRRHTPASPDKELARLWRRSLSSMSLVGVHSRPTDTPTETATVASERFPIAARPLSSLAHVVTEATYAPHTAAGLSAEGRFGTSEIKRCANWTRQIERAVVDSLGPAARLRRHFTTWS